jgi:3-oxoacyl-(acyl-carrier-protein) synthase
MRRVVVTGMGIACPLGIGVRHVWRRLINSESGIGAIQSFDPKDVACKVAGQIPHGTKADGNLDIGEWVPVKDQKKMDRFIHLALVAATEAVEDSGWVPETDEDRWATGHLLGAAGAVEAVFSIMAVRDGIAPPTLNLDEPSRDSVIDRVAHTAQERRISVALSNSFGFGGTNASILFRAAA